MIQTTLRMRLLRPIEVSAKQIYWEAGRRIADHFDPAAMAFYDQLKAGSYDPDHLLKTLPAHNLIYAVVPKAASTRIRATLLRVARQYSRSPKPNRWLKFGMRSPRSMTISSFYRLATSPRTLRFSFVRNPYARAVSCWADKFRGKPLVAGDRLVDMYLAKRMEIDSRLPTGRDCTMSFADFVVFAASTASSRSDTHIQVQADILSMPGITLDLVGKVESFIEDFIQVLDHLGADDAVRRDAMQPLNASYHDHWAEHYTPELAERIYRAYECDFDRFGYARSVIR